MYTALAALLIPAAILFVITRILAARVVRAYPAKGQFADVEGVRIHYTDYPAQGDGSLLPLVFIHGASGNLREQEGALLEPLKGKARLVFPDRPGHGHSGRSRKAEPAGRAEGEVGCDIHEPAGQARVIAGLLDHLAIDKAIIVGHSYGSSVTAALAVNHPEKVAGLVFLAPATHPWPGGKVTWYYHLTMMPVIGWIFSEFLAIPGGHLRYKAGVAEVFHPEGTPRGYRERSGTMLLMRPDVFRFNARDVISLHKAVTRFWPRYREITVPTSIISGDSDDVVLAEIHSKGLARDIAGSKLVWLPGVGHSPHWTRLEAVLAEMERVNEAARNQFSPRSKTDQTAGTG